MALLSFISMLEHMIDEEKATAILITLNWNSSLVLSFAHLAFIALYAYLLVYVWIRFRAVNKLLQAFHSAGDKCSVVHNCTVNVIDRLAELYDKLIRAVSIINECFSLQVSKYACY